MADADSFEPFPTRAGGNAATIVYVLYLVGLLLGITIIVGLVVAYVFRDGAAPWLRTHYRYQIRTFWIVLLYLIIGAVTTFILIGYLILLFTLFWFVIRCVKGLRLASEGMAVTNPATWWV
jgi:uncharacterized membrane protein